MRFSSYALPALAANLAAAMPRPQDIDLDMVLAAPDPTYSEAVGATAQTITVDPQALIASATAAVSSVSVEISDVLSQTAVVSKRAAATPTTCAQQPAGASSAPTYAPGADTDNVSAFRANTYYSSVAAAAPTPSGYTQSFKAQTASNNAFGYMGFDTFDTYDVNTCAQRCTAKYGCVSFNMYFERDPSVNPDDSSCSNPSSVTMIKCVYWGGQVTQDNAQNVGQMRGNFQVAIAGSNGYVTTQISTPAGYQNGVPFGKFAINAPYDAQGYNTYMGAKIFTGTWDVSQCSNYCDAQTKYNSATAPKDGTPAKVCKFFNTYLLQAKLANGTIVPQGQYCSLYTEAWPIKYAVNGGQWRGQDQYTVDYSFGYAKVASSSDIDPTVGDPTGAAYQAVADIKWATLQPFCSSYLGYTTPVTTSMTTTTSTPVVTVTSSSTAAGTTIYFKRDVDPSGIADIPDSILALMQPPQTSTGTQNQKRALSTPAVLTKYPTPVLSSACQMQATKPATSTSVVTVTVTANPTTTTITSIVATADAIAMCSGGQGFKLQVVASGTPYDGAIVQNANRRGAFLGLSIDPYYAKLSPILWNLDQATGALIDATLPSVSMGLYKSWNQQLIMAGSQGDIYPLAMCSLDPKTLLLSCSVDGASTFYVTNDGLYQLSLAGANYVQGDSGFTALPVQVRAVC